MTMLRMLPAALVAAVVLAAGSAQAEMKKEWVEYSHGDAKLKAYVVYDDKVTGKRPAVLMIHSHRLRSAEVPVRMRARTTGVSSINASRSLYYMVKVLLAIFVGLFRARPAIERGDQAPVTAEHSI